MNYRIESAPIGDRPKDQFKNLQDMVDQGLGYWDTDGEFCLLTHGLGGEFQQANEQLVQRKGDEPV